MKRYILNGIVSKLRRSYHPFYGMGLYYQMQNIEAEYYKSLTMDVLIDFINTLMK